MINCEVFKLQSRLIPQVTTLVNTSNKGPSSKKKGRSKKAHVLAMSVEQATQNFLEKGEQIAKDSQDLKEELINAVEEVRKQGEISPHHHLDFCSPVFVSLENKNILLSVQSSTLKHNILLTDLLSEATFEGSVYKESHLSVRDESCNQI